MYDHKIGNKQFEINKLGLIAQRHSELEKNVGYVNTELKDMKAKVNGVQERVEFINNEYEDQAKEVWLFKKLSVELLM